MPVEHGYRQYSKNEWRRELGDTEYSLILAIGGDEAKKENVERENLLINSIAYFNLSSQSSSIAFIQSIEDAFKQAWIGLRLLHSPDVATSFKGKEKVYPSPTNAAELDEWVDRTFDIDTIMTRLDSTIEELVEKAVRERRKVSKLLPTCKVILKQENSCIQGAIILYVSHWRAEAGGCLLMINQLIQYATEWMKLGKESNLAKALKGYNFQSSEVEMLTPSVEEALMTNRISSQIAKDRVAKRLGSMADKMSTDLQVKITGEGKYSNRAPYKIHERIFSVSTTKQLIEKCRQTQISVTSAAHAAYLCALYKDAVQTGHPEQTEYTYASIMPAETRSRIGNGKSALCKQGCWNSSLMLFLCIDLERKSDKEDELDLLAIAKSLKDQYRLANQEDWLYEDARETSGQLNDFFTKMMKVEKVKDTQENFTKPYFTSLGVLDGKILETGQRNSNDDICMNLQKVSAWADSIVPGIVMRVWSLNGKFNVQLASNEAWHDQVQIERLLDQFHTILESQLNISINYEEKFIYSY